MFSAVDFGIADHRQRARREQAADGSAPDHAGNLIQPLTRRIGSVPGHDQAIEFQYSGT